MAVTVVRSRIQYSRTVQIVDFEPLHVGMSFDLEHNHGVGVDLEQAGEEADEAVAHIKRRVDRELKKAIRKVEKELED